jgi:hypothetical protein
MRKWDIDKLKKSNVILLAGKDLFPPPAAVHHMIPSIWILSSQWSGYIPTPTPNPHQESRTDSPLLEARIDIPKHGLQAFFFDPGLD